MNILFCLGGFCSYGGKRAMPGFLDRNCPMTYIDCLRDRTACKRASLRTSCFLVP